MADPDADDLLPLHEVVNELRRQIAQAAQQAQSDDLRFRLDSVELEFSVVARREAGGDGKIKFSVLGFGVEGGIAGKMAHEQTQKIKLSLTPARKAKAVAAGAGAEPSDLLINRRPARQTADRKAAAGGAPR